MRIRTIKPEFFMHEGLHALEVETGLPIRVAYVGIWSACDREGRFVWRPKTLKASILPYDEIDFSRVLDALVTRGFLRKYRVDGADYGCVPSWKRHQFVNNKEKRSEIPEPPETADCDATVTREARDDDATVTDGVKEGKGREGKGREEQLLTDQKKERAAVLSLGPFLPFLPLQQQKPKTTATEAARAEFGEDYDNSETPILDAWEAKFADAISPEPVIACFNGDRSAAELLAEAVEFADADELDRFVTFAKGSAKPFVAKSIRSVHFFATNAGSLLADLRSHESANRAKRGEPPQKQKPEPKEADYLEALRLGVQENSALDKIGVPRQHFGRVLESWRKSADFRASERKAAADGERVREKLRADNAERRKALDAPRVSAADRVSPPSEHERKRTPLTPEQQAARLNELAAQKPQSTGSASAR